eukprot:UN05609
MAALPIYRGNIYLDDPYRICILSWHGVIYNIPNIFHLEDPTSNFSIPLSQNLLYSIDHVKKHSHFS